MYKLDTTSIQFVAVCFFFSEGVMADFLYLFQVCHLLYSVWHWLQSSKIPANQNCVFSNERNLQASALIGG